MPHALTVTEWKFIIAAAIGDDYRISFHLLDLSAAVTSAHACLKTSLINSPPRRYAILMSALQPDHCSTRTLMEAVQFRFLSRITLDKLFRRSPCFV